MITLDSNPETDRELKSLIKESIDKHGFPHAYKKLNDMYKCALRRNHAEHTEFAEKALEYYEELMIKSKRDAFNVKFPDLTSILNGKK